MALTKSIFTGGNQLLGWLIDAGAPIDGDPRLGYPPILQSLWTPGTLDFFIARGANVNAQGGQRRSTALHIAAVQGLLPHVRTLLVAGADANIINSDGDTALTLAARYGKLDAVRLLLESGVQLHRPFDRNYLSSNVWQHRLLTMKVFPQTTGKESSYSTTSKSTVCCGKRKKTAHGRLTLQLVKY
ncbi:ankyrin repeat domain-containing protein [Paraburkholderia sp. RCC_158]|uniref:ankyrin repeat domain-containing protein n=1 Tax=Paraburkholderia sp. RCC_158 TaxID=3239220 RepID=UPI00352655F0